MFDNRYDAGQQLAEKLIKYKDQSNTLILAIPNGGVVCGHVISSRLGLPLEIDYINKILHPDDPEKVIGYVNFETILINNEFDVLKTYIEVEIQRLKKLQFQSRKIFLGEKERIDPKGKTVILVDDGIETGSTIKLSVAMSKQGGAEKIVVAVPVGASKILEDLKGIVDEIVFIESHNTVTSLKDYYSRFMAVKDATLIKLLGKSEDFKY